MVEQRPFKALVVGSSPTQPNAWKAGQKSTEPSCNRAPRRSNNGEQLLLHDSRTSEIELIDVILVEDEGRPKQELAAIDQLEFPEFAGFKLGVARFKLAIHDRSHGVDRSVTKIHRVP